MHAQSVHSSAGLLPALRNGAGRQSPQAALDGGGDSEGNAQPPTTAALLQSLSLAAAVSGASGASDAPPGLEGFSMLSAGGAHGGGSGRPTLDNLLAGMNLNVASGGGPSGNNAPARHPSPSQQQQQQAGGGGGGGGGRDMCDRQRLGVDPGLGGMDLSGLAPLLQSTAAQQVGSARLPPLPASSTGAAAGGAQLDQNLLLAALSSNPALLRALLDLTGRQAAPSPSAQQQQQQPSLPPGLRLPPPSNPPPPPSHHGHALPPLRASAAAAAAAAAAQQHQHHQRGSSSSNPASPDHGGSGDGTPSDSSTTCFNADAIAAMQGVQALLQHIPPPAPTHGSGRRGGGGGGGGVQFDFAPNAADLLAGMPDSTTYPTVDAMYQSLVQVHRRRGNVLQGAAPMLQSLDSQGFAALLKAMGKDKDRDGGGGGGRHHHDRGGDGGAMTSHAFELFDFVVREAMYHATKRRSGEGPLHQHHYETLLDTYSYTTVISLATGSRENSRRGMHYFHQMRELQIQPNTYTYTAMMSIMLKVNDCERALAFYSELMEHGHQPTLVTYKIALDAYGRTDRWDEAYHVFQLIEGEVEMDQRLFTLVLMALGRQSQMLSPTDAASKAVELFACMTGSGVEPNPPIYINLIRVFGKAHMLQQSIMFFDAIEDQGRYPAAYDALATAYDASGQAYQAVQLRQTAQRLSLSSGGIPSSRGNRGGGGQRSGQCTSWNGFECFFEQLHGSCKYCHTHRLGTSNRPGGQSKPYSRR